MTKGGCVYILTNKGRTVLYIGVTSNIHRRMYEHKNRVYQGFTSSYNCYYLLYFEGFWSIEEAIAREKQLKRWHREWKWNLIKSVNPDLKDLSSEWFDKDNNLIEMPL
jgi:putative endonuclease